MAMRTEDFKFLGSNVGYMLTVKACSRIGVASFLSVFAVFGFKVIAAAVLSSVGFYEFYLPGNGIGAVSTVFRCGKLIFGGASFLCLRFSDRLLLFLIGFRVFLLGFKLRKSVSLQ